MGALERFGLKEVLLVGASLGGTIFLVLWAQKKLNTYAALEYTDLHDHKFRPMLHYFKQKKATERDTRGFTDISGPANTQPEKGYWGGYKIENMKVDLTPGDSAFLFFRSAKGYHPWVHLQKGRQRQQAFELIYTSRAHGN